MLAVSVRDSLAEDIANINVKVQELSSESVQKREVLKELQVFNNEKVEELFHLEEIHGSLKRRLYETAN
jgi:hypothetical protein